MPVNLHAAVWVGVALLVFYQSAWDDHCYRGWSQHP